MRSGPGFPPTWASSVTQLNSKAFPIQATEQLTLLGRSRTPGQHAYFHCQANKTKCRPMVNGYEPFTSVTLYLKGQSSTYGSQACTVCSSHAFDQLQSSRMCDPTFGSIKRMHSLCGPQVNSMPFLAPPIPFRAQSSLGYIHLIQLELTSHNR